MILCCGEALIDMVPIRGEDGQEGFAPLAGGAIFNTAIALGRLGVETGFLSGLSRDLFGEKLAEVLAASHVASDLSIRSDRPTTLAFVKLTDGHATYTFYDENTAGRMFGPGDVPALPDAVEALYFGGISLISEPAAEAYRALCAREAGRRVVMLDPNIRPGFITDPDTYRARIDAMLGHADIVKASDEDLAWLIGGDGAPEDQLAALKARGPGIAILTRGARGAVALFGDGERAEVPGRPVDVCDTVGAGDTFNAGVLASLQAQGLLSKAALGALDAGAMAAALDHGARVAAVTVSRDGADPPWAHEL